MLRKKIVLSLYMNLLNINITQTYQILKNLKKYNSFSLYMYLN